MIINNPNLKIFQIWILRNVNKYGKKYVDIAINENRDHPFLLSLRDLNRENVNICTFNLLKIKS